MRILLIGWRGLWAECLQVLLEEKEGFQVMGALDSAAAMEEFARTETADALIVAADHIGWINPGVLARIKGAGDDPLKVVTVETDGCRRMPLLTAGREINRQNDTVNEEFNDLVSAIES